VDETRSSDPIDGDDVAAVRRSDRMAFKRLVARHDDGLLHLAARLLGDLREAEDMRQAAWLRIWRALPGFDGHARFRTWAWRIVVNGCRDARRRATARLATASQPLTTAATVPDPAPGPASTAIDCEDARAVRHALDQLPDDERERLVLRHWHDLAPGEIAAVVDRPRTTVQSCLARALTRLALKLRRRGVGEEWPAPARAPGSEGTTR
jgi:RNA polymerase sigma-70 factor (ECF subfamily)